MSYYPRRPLLMALLALAGLGPVPLLWPVLWFPWELLLATLAVVALADLWLLRGMREPAVQRILLDSLAQTASQKVTLRAVNRGRAAMHLTLYDHHPDDFEAQGLPLQLMLPGAASAETHYWIRPRQRGDHVFTRIDAAWRSPLSLWSRVQRTASPQAVRVYPNFGQLSHLTLLADRNRLATAGVRRRQRRGAGNEFHQLRDFQQGDSLRQVDWKATGRYRRLISREYQEEQNQRLFFLLDCGQRMRHRDAEGSHLDAALNGMLLAAHMANKQGDAVGYMTFAGSERYLAPSSGSTTLPLLLRSAYDVDSSNAAADYLRMAHRFLARPLRRALVVLITNTRDGDQDDLLQAVRLLQRKHLVLVADLRESRLDQALGEPVRAQAQAMRFHTALGLRQSRAQMHEALRHQGVLVLDLLPGQLSLALINQYFELKRSARL